MTAAVLFAWLLGCPPADRGHAAPLAVEYAGCVESAAGCELTPGEPLRVWLPAPDATLRLDDVVVAAQAEAVADGARLTWTDPAPGVLAVDTAAGSSSLRLVPPRPRPWEATLRGLAPDACREAGATLLDRASSVGDIDTTEPAPGAAPHAAPSPEDRAPLLWSLAGCDLRAGDRPAAIARMRDAAEAFDAAGRPFDAARARLALSSVLFGAEGSLVEVRALLDRVPDAPPNATLAWGAAWHRALLHRRSGDYRAALAALAAAHDVAARVGLDRERDLALEQRAVVDAELGHLDAAVATQRALVDATPFSDGDCAQDARAAGRRNNLAWFLLLRARDRETAPDPDVAPLLERARDAHVACGHPARDIANVEVNLALAAWLSGDLDRTRAHLAAARAVQPDPDPLYAAWSAELEGRVALAEGRLAEARAAFDRAVDVARLRGAPEATAQALAGRAEVRWAASDRDGALADLAAAHDALWDGTALIPLDAGAAAFLATRRAMTERYVAALLELGRPADALAVVRTARSHLVRAGHVRARLEALDPAARARWEAAVTRYRAVRAEREAAAADAWALSAEAFAARAEAMAARDEEAGRALDDALAALGSAAPPTPAPPRPGDLLLAWFPLGERWVGFAATADTVAVARIGALPSDPARAPAAAEALAEALLGPFADAIARAERVVVLPWGDLRAVDLHALPFRGAPLLARVPVVYSLDLGTAGAPPSGPPLVVADPTGDLPGARAEAATVGAAWPDARVLLGADARRADVLAALASAGALHYAGHATFEEGDAWAAGLPLADGVVRVGDVLALPRVPPRVVLSACESGRAEAATVETWGLAQAFVAGGAAAVVATSRPVGDRAGARLADALYASAAPALPEAARSAQLRLLAEGSEDWSAFRVWVP